MSSVTTALLYYNALVVQVACSSGTTYSAGRDVPCLRHRQVLKSSVAEVALTHTHQMMRHATPENQLPDTVLPAEGTDRPVEEAGR
jgi:hypothetical protein